MAGLTAKQEAFCLEYLKDLNATQAAVRAGYSVNTAQEQGSRLLSNVMVQKRLSELKAVRIEELKIDANHVLARLVAIDEMDLLDIMNDDMSFKPLKEWPKVWRQFLSGVSIEELFEFTDTGKVPIGMLKKIKWPDKLRNLELIGRHVNVNAFKEQVEHSGKIQTAGVMSDEQFETIRREAREAAGNTGK